METEIKKTTKKFQIKNENIIKLIDLLFRIFFELVWRTLKWIYNLIDKFFKWIMEKFSDKKDNKKEHK